MMIYLRSGDFGKLVDTNLSLGHCNKKLFKFEKKRFIPKEYQSQVEVEALLMLWPRQH